MPNFYILNVKTIKSVSNFLIQNFSERQNLSWNTLILNMLEACLILRRKFYLCFSLLRIVIEQITVAP